MPAREEMTDLQESVHPALREILNQLEGGDIHHVSAAEALDFLFANWTQAIRMDEIEDDGCRPDNLIDGFDRLVELLRSLRPAVRDALEKANAENAAAAAP